VEDDEDRERTGRRLGWHRDVRKQLHLTPGNAHVGEIFQGDGA
jgi:hypothetical protein